MVARCLLDNDDEVRDRALLYLEVLKQKQKALSSAYILNSECVHMWRVMEVREGGGSEEKTQYAMFVLSLYVGIFKPQGLFSLVPRPHPLTRRNGQVNQVEFLWLAHAFCNM